MRKASLFIRNTSHTLYAVHILSSTPLRLLRYAIKNITRSFFLSLSSVVVITLMTFLIFVLFFAEFVTKSLAERVNARLSLKPVVKTGLEATSLEVIDTLEALRKVDPGIKAEFISAADAFENLKKRDPELAKVIESDAENPLPSTISIENVPIEKYADLDRVISEHPEAIDVADDKRKKSLLDYKAQYDRIRDVIHVLVSLQYGLFAIIGFFLFSVFVVVFQSIGNAVFYFREEIKITELVGGQKRYIYGPFMLQGLIYTATALVISTILFVALLKNTNFSLLLSAPIFISNFFDSVTERYLILAALLLLL
jgi:cell division transport system permease protein